MLHLYVLKYVATVQVYTVISLISDQQHAYWLLDVHYRLPTCTCSQ